MNSIVSIQAKPLAAKIAHSVMGYDRKTEELALELPIPLFLDTLALKIAAVPLDDQEGAASYALQERAVTTFRFLLGLSVDLTKREYFLEPTVGYTEGFTSRKLEAVELLTKGAPRSRSERGAMPFASERELVVPMLRLLQTSENGWMAINDLIARLTDLFDPVGQGATTSDGRTDLYFSQQVRDMISHRGKPSSFIHQGLAHYERHGLQISDQGRSTVEALLS